MKREASDNTCWCQSHQWCWWRRFLITWLRQCLSCSDIRWQPREVTAVKKQQQIFPHRVIYAANYLWNIFTKQFIPSQYLHVASGKKIILYSIELSAMSQQTQHILRFLCCNCEWKRRVRLPPRTPLSNVRLTHIYHTYRIVESNYCSMLN